MTGLTESEFDCFFECLKLFLNALVYPDCKSSERSKCGKMDKRTELMCLLSIHLDVIGWMTNTSASTQSRLFVAWSVFLVYT